MGKKSRVVGSVAVGSVVAALALAVTPALADPADTQVVPAIIAKSSVLTPLLDTGSVKVVQGGQFETRLYRSVDGGPLTLLPTAAVAGSDLWQSSGSMLFLRNSDLNTFTRLDPVTGAESVLDTGGVLPSYANDVGYLVTGWNDETGTEYADYVEGGSTYRHDFELEQGVCDLDATTILLCTTQFLPDGSRTVSLATTPAKGSAVTPLATVPALDSGVSAELTTTSVVVVVNDDLKALVHRVPRAGTTVTTATVPIPSGQWLNGWASSDTATMVTLSASARLATGGVVSTVAPPTGVELGGAVTSPTGFTAWGSGSDVSGLYPVSAAGVVGARLVAGPPVPVTPDTLVLNAGRLWGSDDREGLDRSAGPTQTVWSRSLGATVGAESVFPQRASSYGSHFTANRTYLETGPATTKLMFFDGPTKTYSATGPNIRVASGPYVGLVSYSATPASTVRRADGALVTTLPSGSTILAMFGSRLVFSNGVNLYLQDLARAASTTNPKKIGTWNESYNSPSMWGDRFVYTTGTAVKVLDVRTGVISGSLTSSAWMVKADDGVIVLYDGGLKAWTGVSGAAPVAVTSSAHWVWDVDEGKVAWISQSDQHARVGSLPFGGTSKPRLLGIMGLPSVFAPNVAGQGTAWKPQVDLTKNLSSWSLSIKNPAGTVVRTLTGGATSNASIRTASWDGKNASGVLQPNGTYTWTLTGSASDGSGSLVGVDGTSTIAGSIKLSTQAPSAAMSNAALASTVSASTAAPVTWKAVNAAPGTTTSFEVQVRSVTVSSTGARVYGAWSTFQSWATAASRSHTASASSVREFRVRAKDNFGRIGSWSGTGSMVWPVDDRSLTESGAWTESTSGSYWAGTYRRSGTSGTALSKSSVWTSRISVVGAKSANSGKVKVYVDGTLKATVDLYSSTTKYRQTLWTGPVTYGKHTVKVVVSPVSTTRKYAYLDGIGFAR